MLQGAAGYKSVMRFDAAGSQIAVTHDFGERHQVITGSAKGSMLFPLLPAGAGPVYARLDDIRSRAPSRPST